jgi:hypothetical protein
MKPKPKLCPETLRWCAERVRLNGELAWTPSQLVDELTRLFRREATRAAKGRR